METKTERIMSSHAQVSKLVRQELKIAFPNTKFQVTSECYSGGNSVRASWTDGPTTDQVDQIMNKYQEGHFNGMEDIYEYSNTRTDIPQVKFVFADRTMSDYIKDAIISKHNSEWGEEGQIKDIQARNVSLNEWNNTVIYRYFQKLDLS